MRSRVEWRGASRGCGRRSRRAIDLRLCRVASRHDLQERPLLADRETNEATPGYKAYEQCVAAAKCEEMEDAEDAAEGGDGDDDDDDDDDQ